MTPIRGIDRNNGNVEVEVQVDEATGALKTDIGAVTLTPSVDQGAANAGGAQAWPILAYVWDFINAVAVKLAGYPTGALLAVSALADGATGSLIDKTLPLPTRRVGAYAADPVNLAGADVTYSSPYPSDIYVTTGGNVKVDTVSRSGGTSTITIVAAPVGPLGLTGVKKIYSTANGTTAAVSVCD